MNDRTAATLADLARADAVLDARSPSEFAEDHLPGAQNTPVLDDAERALVGTLFAQQGPFEARRVGGALVAARLAEHLRTRFASMPRDWRPLVYCWRGGLRSGAMVSWLRLVGWDARQLSGGYKTWRRHVVGFLETQAATLPLVVLSGPTGSAKSRVLNALARRTEQVLDLEALACHKGSVLGGWPGQPQPSQKHFETRLVAALQPMRLDRPIYVEAESARIGQVALPLALRERLRSSPCLEIVADFDVRLRFLLHDYAYLGDDRHALAEQLERLRRHVGHATTQRWLAWAHEGTLDALYADLMRVHYDPHYARSQNAHLRRLHEAERLPAATLDDAGIEALAEAVAARGPRLVAAGAA